MITPPERSVERDAAIDRLLPYAAEAGWNAVLSLAADQPAAMCFPGGATELVEACVDLMDRRMVEAAHPKLAGQRLPGRVRALIQARLELAAPHKPVMRRTALFLASPANAAVAARCLARSVDAIWHAAGDASADFSWYTKRAILAGVYTSTLLYWLNGETTIEAALAFLDRRLAGVARIGRLRRKAAAVLF